MKKFINHPVLFWQNKIAIHTARRNSYKPDSIKWLKFDALVKRDEYMLAAYKAQVKAMSDGTF